MLDNVILVRNIFYKCFLIGVLFVLIAFLLYMFNPDFVVGMVEKYYKLDAKESTILLSAYFILARMILLFFMLVPALALHWTSWSLKKANK